MWELIQTYVSIAFNEAIKHPQYLGDDGEAGEVGEVGEYFGEARVISAGARWRVSKGSCHSKPVVTLTSYEIKGMTMTRASQSLLSFRT
jgi:hypothetical protein